MLTAEEETTDTLSAMRPWIRSVIARRAPAGEVDDLVQEVFVAALAATELPEEPPRLRAWLFQVASRRVADHFRRGRRPQGAFDGTDVECPQPGAWQWLSAAEDRERLTKAWHAISADARNLLGLRYVRTLTYRQIADTTGLTERAIEYRLQTAREELKALLGEDGR